MALAPIEASTHLMLSLLFIFKRLLTHHSHKGPNLAILLINALKNLLEQLGGRNHTGMDLIGNFTDRCIRHSVNFLFVTTQVLSSGFLTAYEPLDMKCGFGSQRLLNPHPTPKRGETPQAARQPEELLAVEY